MKRLASILTIFVTMSSASAHDHNHAAMEAEEPSASSIFNLESKWTDQQGSTVSLSSLAGRPRLVAMVYTRCETACPLIVEDLKDVARDLGSIEGKTPVVTVISIDSARETPQSLAQFAKKRNLPNDWVLLTSRENAVAELAGALGVRYKKLPSGDYIHSNLIFFLNPRGEIVARKEGLKTPRGEFLAKIRATR